MTQCTILTLTVSKFSIKKHVLNDPVYYFDLESFDIFDRKTRVFGRKWTKISKFQIFDQKHVLNDQVYDFDLESFDIFDRKTRVFGQKWTLATSKFQNSKFSINTS